MISLRDAKIVKLERDRRREKKYLEYLEEKKVESPRVGKPISRVITDLLLLTI